MNKQLRAKVLMVCTREIPEQSENGRERTMAFIRQSLSERGEVQFFRLRSVLEQRSLRQMLFIGIALLHGIVRGRPLPLQSLLFYDPIQARELAATVAREAPATVYFDGVRSGTLSVQLRKLFPKLRIVCDFDDLMSRRMETLLAMRVPVSMGYLSKNVPKWVQTYVLDGVIGRLVKSYEKFALISEEKTIVAACDTVVLVSSVDAQNLLSFTLGPVNVIPPVMAVNRTLSEISVVKRFVFIGSDSQLQNRLTIEFLMSLWKRMMPQTELHIFGKQRMQYAQVQGVVFHGFIGDLGEAYTPGSILLAPAFLSGGVKTKVLESMAYGVIPLGTRITFEGVDSSFEGLMYSDKEWEAVVSDPARFVKGWNTSGLRAFDNAIASHSAKHLADCWCRVVWPN